MACSSLTNKRTGMNGATVSDTDSDEGAGEKDARLTGRVDTCSEKPEEARRRRIRGRDGSAVRGQEETAIGQS